MSYKRLYVLCYVMLCYVMLRQLEGTEPVEAKDRINDYGTCESDE